MEFKITELMSDYTDHEFSPAEDQETSVERIKEMTMNKLNRGRKPVRKMSRLLLIAAVVILALTATALAVYQATMAERAIVTESDHLEEGYHL